MRFTLVLACLGEFSVAVFYPTSKLVWCCVAVTVILSAAFWRYLDKQEE